MERDTLAFMSDPTGEALRATANADETSITERVESYQPVLEKVRSTPRPTVCNCLDCCVKREHAERRNEIGSLLMARRDKMTLEERDEALKRAVAIMESAPSPRPTEGQRVDDDEDAAICEAIRRVKAAQPTERLKCGHESLLWRLRTALLDSWQGVLSEADFLALLTETDKAVEEPAESSVVTHPVATKEQMDAEMEGAVLTTSDGKRMAFRSGQWEPDLDRLWQKGQAAWSNVPSASAWVEELRGNEPQPSEPASDNRNLKTMEGQA